MLFTHSFMCLLGFALFGVPVKGLERPVSICTLDGRDLSHTHPCVSFGNQSSLNSTVILCLTLCCLVLHIHILLVSRNLGDL